MKTQRFEILTLATAGQISSEEADRLLVALGTKQRRAARVFWATAVVVVVPALILGFHQGEHVRMIFATILQRMDSMEYFRQVHVAISRLIQAL